MLGWYWASVADDGPTLTQHWVSVSCWLVCMSSLSLYVTAQQQKMFFLRLRKISVNLPSVSFWLHVFGLFWLKFFSNSSLHSDIEKGCTFLYITMQQEQLQYHWLKPRELNICGYLASGFLAFSGYRFLALWPSQISWLMHSRSCSWWRTWLWRTLLDWLSALTRGAAKTMLHCLIIIK